MNILIGVNMAYLSFVPNAGNSLMFSIIAITMYIVLSVISIVVYYKAKINQDNEVTHIQRAGEQYRETWNDKTPLAV